MPDVMDEYYERIDLPCQAYNLWAHLQMTHPMKWDFENIRKALDRIEASVNLVKERKKAA